MKTQRWTALAAWCAISGFGFLPPAWGASAANQAENSASNDDVLGLWHVENMLQQACRTITQRYNLNPEQEKYTEALMTKKLKGFLQDHETELRGLLTDMITARLTGNVTGERARRWAEKARPIFEAAEETIIEGNQTWRRILTEEQKAIHDRDLRDMRVTFSQLHERFDRWAAGDFDKVREGFARRPSPGGSARVNDPRRELATLTRPTVGRAYSANHEDAWEAYVRRFIEDYKLDESQQQSALAILDEEKERAIQYRQANAEKSEQIRNRLRELAASGASADERAEAQQELRALSKPIVEIFNRLRARLDAIPTGEQKQARQERFRDRVQKRMAELRERGQQKDESPPAQTQDTRPTETEGASEGANPSEASPKRP